MVVHASNILRLGGKKVTHSGKQAPDDKTLQKNGADGDPFAIAPRTYESDVATQAGPQTRE